MCFSFSCRPLTVELKKILYTILGKQVYHISKNHLQSFLSLSKN
ncbi:MAG: hypothetical protein LBV23_06880 [Deltaproteobacteria bacterium]|nr:hypothetical protein [Deltaproteobacteria bacterium]